MPPDNVYQYNLDVSVHCVAVCCASNMSTEHLSTVTTTQGHNDNTETNATTIPTVLTTEPKVNVKEMTTKATVALQDSVDSVPPALTSVEPARSPSDEPVYENTTSPGTAPSTSLTASATKSPLVSANPTLTSSQVGNISIATDSNMSVTVSQTSNSSDMVTTSPRSTITVTPEMSPAPQNASMQFNVSSVLTTSKPEMSTDSNDTVTVMSELPKMSTLSNDTATVTSILPDIMVSVMPPLNVSMNATLAVSMHAIMSSTVAPDNVTDQPAVTVSSDANVTTTATTNGTTSLVVNASSPEAVAPSDKVYELVFEGNCSILELPGFREQFVKVLSSLIKMEFKLKDEDLKIDDEITCGSLIVDVHLFNFNPAMDAKMMTMGNSSLSLNVTAGSVTFYMPLLKVSNVPYETPLSTSAGSTTEMPSIDGIVLSHTEQIIVIVCAIVGGSLLIFGVLSIVYTCHTRNYKSFDLGETPTANVNMEDFTLTKMDRSYPLYDDQDMVVAYDSDVKPVSPDSVYHYQHGYFPRTTAPLSTFKSAETFEPQTLVAVGREGDTDRHAALTGSHHSSGDITDTETGFENPSFSGEDFLDPAAEHMVEDLQKHRGSK